MKKFLFLGLAFTIVVSMIFPLATNSGRPEKAILWTRYLGEGLGFSAPVIDSERVYVACPTKILCFVLDSGELLWERDFPKPHKSYFGQINVSIGKKYAYYCNPEGLYCLDKGTGKIVWQKQELFTSNAEVATDTVYVASGLDIYQIDATTGKTKAVVNVYDKHYYTFITFVERNKVVASTLYGMKKLVDLKSQTVVWESNKNNTELLDKPVVCGKYLAVSGYLMKYEWLLFIELDTGKIAKSMNQQNSCFDTSDGRFLASDFCYSTDTLEPIWQSGIGISRFYDCFDSVFFRSYDDISILDWNGNPAYSKHNNNRDIDWTLLFWDDVCIRPAASNGKYALLTQFGFLVCYQNKPDLISYTIGDDHFVAEGKDVYLENKPFANDKGELMVEPRGFLEPLGWVSSHVDGWWKDKITDLMVFHDYNRIIAITASNDAKLLKSIRAEKILNCQKTPDGHLVLPLETMVTEFELTMTKDGDKFKLSYQSK